MFDFIRRMIYGELPKDKVRNYVLEKMKKEKEHEDFLLRCKNTPSFSRCVISNPKRYNAKLIVKKKAEMSQKQKQQLRSYKDAVINKPVDL